MAALGTAALGTAVAELPDVDPFVKGVPVLEGTVSSTNEVRALEMADSGGS